MFTSRLQSKEKKNDRTLSEKNRKEKERLISSVVSKANFPRSPFVRKRGPGKGKA